MSAELSQQPITAANGSGFPLQIATISIVNQSEHWRVILEEHPWHIKDAGSEGFIDVVALNRKRNLEVMVIECKRVRQSGWVFLVPKSPPTLRTQATAWVSQRIDQKWAKYGWENWPADPSSYLSYYCAIPGQEQGRKNLLERVASDLIDSIEGLANQEKELHSRPGIANFSRVYIPVVITTAQLFVAHFDPTAISIHDGSLPKETPVEEVPYVRFRKSLATNFEYESASSVMDIHGMSERTIFIVNAENLPKFLAEFELNG